MSYWDTSALSKLYLAEPDSVDFVQKAASDPVIVRWQFAHSTRSTWLHLVRMAKSILSPPTSACATRPNSSVSRCSPHNGPRWSPPFRPGFASGLVGRPRVIL